MKGRKGCYAGGGKMRDIGGVMAPEYGQSTKVMDLAKNTKSEGKVGMAGIGADGVPVKSRLDRPGRKHGGAVNAASREEKTETVKTTSERESDDADEDDDAKYAKGGNVHWMKDAVKHPGALRKALHVKEGEKISEKKLEKAEHSDNPTMRKRAALAETFRKARKG